MVNRILAVTLLLISMMFSTGALAASAADAGVSIPSWAIMDRPTQAPIKVPAFDRILAAAEQTGSVKVIVRFAAPAKLSHGFQPEASISDLDAVATQQSAIVTAQETVLSRVSKINAVNAKRYTHIPFMALEVTRAELSILLNSPEIDLIEEDALAEPTLAQSVPLIGADLSGTFSGYTGTGQTVAILDTGVDRAHSFLAGKVIDEACFSTTYAPYASTSVCPNTRNIQTGPGAGTNCSLAIHGCYHGTHVAGIAAGNGNTSSGVAKNASILAVQVFSRFDSGCSTNPCPMSYTSDQIGGLDWVYSKRNLYNISAVNMSLGGSAVYATNCDATNVAQKAAIDTLRAAGIATIIAAGNNSSSTGISAPGCISTAISTGATTKDDVVASYSNSAPILNLLAPGSSITSSYPGNFYATLNGTSMATPHVVGAWAVMKSKNTTASVDTVLSALTTSGVPITDGRNAITKPRINVPAALALITATPRCSLSGTVYAFSGARPVLAGATVAIAGLTATTDASGAFSIAEIPAGIYPLSISMAGYTTYSNAAFILNGDKARQVFMLSVEATYTFSGSVRAVNASGPLLGSAFVSIAGKTATTSNNGTFLISGIPAGTYSIIISRPEYKTYINAAYAMNSNRTGQVFYLASTAGNLVNEDFEGALVPALPADWLTINDGPSWSTYAGTVNPSGIPAHSGSKLVYFNSYTIAGGTADLVSPSFSLAGAAGSAVKFWMYRDGGYATSADKIDVYVNSAPALTGTATLLGTVNRSRTLAPVVATNGWYEYTFPVPDSLTGSTHHVILHGTSAWGNDIHLDDISVVKSRTLSGILHSGSVTGPVLAGATVDIAGKTTTTDATGAFSISGILPDTYTLTISKADYNTYTDAAYTMNIDKRGQVFYLQSSLAATFTLSGTVTSGNATGPALAGAIVAVGPSITTTDASGAFSISGIPAGTYSLIITKTGYAPFINAAYVINNNMSRQVFTLLAVPTYSLLGTVRSGTTLGAPIAGASVSLAGKRAITNANGQFFIDGIPAVPDPPTVVASQALVDVGPILSISKVGYAPFAVPVNLTGNSRRVFVLRPGIPE